MSKTSCTLKRCSALKIRVLLREGHNVLRQKEELPLILNWGLNRFSHQGRTPRKADLSRECHPCFLFFASDHLLIARFTAVSAVTPLARSWQHRLLRCSPATTLPEAFEKWYLSPFFQTSSNVARRGSRTSSLDLHHTRTFQTHTRSS